MNNINDVCLKDSQWRGYALKLCKCPDKANDLVQDMYINLMQINKPIKDWYVIATIRNIYFNEIKSFEYQNTTYIYDNKEYKKKDFGIITESIEDQLIKKDIENQLNQKVKQLSNKKKSTIDMFYFKGLSCKDISNELNESVNNVCKILYDARTKLKQ